MGEPSPSILKLALTRLSRSAISKKELLSYLEGKGQDPVESETVVSYLEGRTILSDRKTIESLVESKSGKRSIGIEKLRATLNERGFPEELIDEALASREDGGIDQVLLAKYKPTDRRDRAARFLLSRGFDEESVAEAIDRFFGPAPFAE
jgi:regulatory protein